MRVCSWESRVSLFRREQVRQDDGMKSLRVVAFVCLLVPSLHSRSVRHSSRTALDPTYSSALAAANRFLHAWQDQDHEAGILMLADSGRQHASPGLLQSFFSPGPDAAYEIAHGQRLKPNEYVFPLVLFGSSSDPHPRSCKLIVVRAGK